MNKFDKPYRLLGTYDTNKVLELFNLVNNLDTNELLQYSFNNQIPFDVINDTGDCLIHEVIKMDIRKTNQTSKLNIIKFLVQNSVNPDSPNKMNQTPLHLACNYQLDLIVEYLLSINVNPNYTDNIGLYPFHYLFFGEIKPIGNTSKVLDFVEPPIQDKTDFLNKPEIIKIKKKLWEIIIKNPFLITIKNTIDNFINSEDNINVSLIKLFIDKDPHTIKTSQIISNIKSNNNKIITNIKKKFNNFKSMDFIIEYKKENYKKLIKEKILETITKIKDDDIIKFTNLLGGGNDKDKKQRTEVVINLDSIMDNASSFIDFINNIYIGGSRKINIINNNINLNKITIDFTVINDDDILFPIFKKQILKDKNNLQLYIEHSNKIDNIENTIKNIDNSFNSINNIYNIFDYPDNQKILYLLINSDILDINIISNYLNVMNITECMSYIIYFLTNTKEDFDISKYYYLDMTDKILEKEELMKITDEKVKGEIIKRGADRIIAKKERKKRKERKEKMKMLLGKVLETKGGTPFKIDEDKFEDDDDDDEDEPPDFNILNKSLIYITNFALYIIMGYIAIIQMNNNIDLELLKKELLYYDINKNNNFFNKWFNKLFKGKKNIGLCIYGMYCDLDSFLYSSDNLTCNVPFNLIALINGLNSDDIIQGVINAYKPHIISNIIKDNNENLDKCLLLLLNDNIDKNFIDFIQNDTETIHTYFDKNINFNSKIKDFIKLINLYIMNCTDNDYNTTINAYKEMYKEKYNKIKDVNVFQEIIKELYNNLKNKPLLQTVNDIIYFIGLLDIKDKEGDNKFKNISIIHFINNDKYIHNDKSEQPSLYNIKLKNDNNDIEHFIVSHLMGLYYLNTIENEKLEDLNYYFNQLVRKLDDTDLSNDETNDYLWIKDFKLSNELKLKGIYNTENIKIPTKENIIKIIEKKITSSKSLIKNNLNHINSILDELEDGKIKNFHKIYITYYIAIYKIYNLGNILGSIIQQNITYNINNLQNNLNTLNAILFIYYYLKDNRDTVKLSRFNYYLLNINSKDYYYYNDYEYDEPYEPMIGGKLYDFDNQIYNNEFIEYNNIEISKHYLPPSIYNDLNIFYLFGIYKLFDDIIGNNNIIIDIDSYLTNNKYYNKDNNIKNNILYKLINEIVSQELNIYLHNKVIEKTLELDIDIEIDLDLFKTKDMAINLSSTLIDIKKLFFNKDKLNFKNIYSIIEKSKENDKFIIYQNDFNNTHKLKIKNYFYVNENIIEILLKYNSLLFNSNLDDMTPMHSLIKIYNNKLINNLKLELNNKNIKLKDYIGSKTIKFINQECENNLNKILNNYENTMPINKIFYNINNYLYNDVKLLITSNESFGNNVLLYLEDSFNICSYLTLHYLSEHLTNIDINFSFDSANELFKLINYDIDNIINMNYLEEKLEELKIIDDDEKFIANELLIDKKKELKINNDNLMKIENSLKKLKNDSNIYKKMIISTQQELYELTTNKEILCKEIFLLNELIKKNNNLIKKINNCDNNNKLIDVYKKYSSKMSINNIWSKILNYPLKNNYNLILLDILLKQKEILNNKDNNKEQNINIINNGLEHISKLCESYFNKDNYTSGNVVLSFIKEILEYLTCIIICNSIEYMMRKILYIYFYNSSTDNYFESINDKINYIIESKIDVFDKSFKEILYENISWRLVKSSVNIFENNSEKNLYLNESVREILSELFDHLDIFGDILSENIKEVFKLKVVSYFDSFTSRTILLWMVNIENIFKYFINIYRSSNILILLSYDNNQNNSETKQNEDDDKCNDVDCIIYNTKPIKAKSDTDDYSKNTKFIKLDDTKIHPWKNYSDTLFINFTIKNDSRLHEYLSETLKDYNINLDKLHLTIYIIYIPLNGTIDKFIKNNFLELSKEIKRLIKLSIQNIYLNPNVPPYKLFSKYYAIDYNNINISNEIDDFRSNFRDYLFDKTENKCALATPRDPIYIPPTKDKLKFYYYKEVNTDNEIFAIDEYYNDSIKPHISIIKINSETQKAREHLDSTSNIDRFGSSMLKIDLLQDVELNITYGNLNIQLDFEDEIETLHVTDDGDDE